MFGNFTVNPLDQSKVASITKVREITQKKKKDQATQNLFPIKSIPNLIFQIEQ